LLIIITITLTSSRTQTIIMMSSAIETENPEDTASVAASLSAMMEKELTIYSCTGYLNLNMTQSSPPNHSNSKTIMITSNDRMALVDWCYGVVDHCQYSRETVASAMDMVDRFLSIRSSTADKALRSPDILQLLVVTALYVAIKLNERVVMSSSLFVEITRYVYTVEEIEDMERTLLSGLSWRCCAPTASQIGHSILSLILPHVDVSDASWAYLMDEIIYQIEYAVQDYYFCTQRASTIALAAICNAVKDRKQMSIHEHRAFLEALPRIKESFNFDSTEVIVAACKRLQALLHRENVEVEDDVVPEASLTSRYTEVRSVMELELHLLS
jgi:hypothetical protein